MGVGLLEGDERVGEMDRVVGVEDQGRGALEGGGLEDHEGVAELLKNLEEGGRGSRILGGNLLVELPKERNVEILM